jgi:hypothetical protein
VRAVGHGVLMLRKGWCLRRRERFPIGARTGARPALLEKKVYTPLKENALG